MRQYWIAKQEGHDQTVDRKTGWADRQTKRKPQIGRQRQQERLSGRKSIVSVSSAWMCLARRMACSATRKVIDSVSELFTFLSSCMVIHSQVMRVES